MPQNDFTQTRADEIVRGALSGDAGAFRDAVALSAGVLPEPEAVRSLPLPRDLRLEATTFRALSDTTAHLTASGGGDTAELGLVVQDGTWKIDSRGSDGSIVRARAS
ncbi:hypothetical protein [Microbacterium sp.]|uniref:hypothetical protein n=1 Tax=Microbacterium sp. TaxID=51671 RepID=UPI00333F23AB